MIQQVESNATNAMMSMRYGPDRDVLKYKLADIDRRFTAVSEKSTQRKQTLDSIQPLTGQYHDVMNAFLIYLDSAEDKLESLKKVPRDEDGAARHKADAQVTRELCVTFRLEKGCVTSCYSPNYIRLGTGYYVFEGWIKQKKRLKKKKKKWMKCSLLSRSYF